MTTDFGARALVDPIELFLLDGQTMFRDGLRLLAEQQPDLVVVGVAADATSGPTCDGVPDVVVADLSFPDARDVGGVDRLRKTFPGSALLILTLADHPKHVERMLKVGVDGYILKTVAASELFYAIRTVARGGSYLQPSLGVAIARARAVTATETMFLSELTIKETEVLRLLAKGNTNREVAEQRGVSLRTIEAQRARVLQKTGLHTRAELVLHAHVLGIDGRPD